FTDFWIGLTPGLGIAERGVRLEQVRDELTRPALLRGLVAGGIERLRLRGVARLARRDAAEALAAALQRRIEAGDVGAGETLDRLVEGESALDAEVVLVVEDDAK